MIRLLFAVSLLGCGLPPPAPHLSPGSLPSALADVSVSLRHDGVESGPLGPSSSTLRLDCPLGGTILFEGLEASPTGQPLLRQTMQVTWSHCAFTRFRDGGAERPLALSGTLAVERRGAVTPPCTGNCLCMFCRNGVALDLKMNGALVVDALGDSLQLDATVKTSNDVLECRGAGRPQVSSLDCSTVRQQAAIEGTVNDQPFDGASLTLGQVTAG